jgi:hypothetical protein
LLFKLPDRNSLNAILSSEAKAAIGLAQAENTAENSGERPFNQQCSLAYCGRP